MKEKIKLIKPYISFEEMKDELKEIFDSGQLTKGKNVQKLVKDLSAYTGAEFAFLTTSATTALTMCLKVLDIQEGDKVAVSDFSFPATANVVEDIGAVPIFIDVDPKTFNMCETDLINKLKDDVKAVIFVDALGNPSGIDSIVKICKQKNIPIIEDSACAIGSSCNGQKVGNIADLTCFSFHPRKLLTTGEGGAILSNNADYTKFLDTKLNHGAFGYKGLVFDFVDYGYNYRMSEVQALMGWKQLLKLDKIVEDRQRIALEYSKKLCPLGFSPQLVSANCSHNVQSVVLTVPKSIERDVLVKKLAAEGIETTIGTYCLSGTTYYKKKYNNVQPKSKVLEETTITLPCYEGVDVNYISKRIARCVTNG